MADILVDRTCVLLDGACHCECPESDCKYSGKPFPTQEYDALDKDHPNTCRCEVCRFWS